MVLSFSRNCFPWKQHSLFLAVLILFSSTLTAQSIPLSKFKSCSESSSVGLIPFSDINREANAMSDEVKRRKVDIKEYGWKVWTDKTDAILDKKFDKDEDIAETKKQIAALKSAGKTADATAKEKELATLNTELTRIKSDIKALNSDLKEGLEAWKRMMNARGGLREAFKDAKDACDRAKSNPKTYLGSSASDDDVTQAKKFIDTIKTKIIAEEKVHSDEEKGANTNIGRFEALVKRTTI